MKPKLYQWMLASGLVLALNSCAAAPETREQMQAQATVTRAKAQQVALAKVPGGKVKSAELEREHGLLIWSFDIASSGSRNITEVAVDARTGQVASVETESPEMQAKEAAEDKHG